MPSRFEPVLAEFHSLVSSRPDNLVQQSLVVSEAVDPRLPVLDSLVGLGMLNNCRMPIAVSKWAHRL